MTSVRAGILLLGIVYLAFVSLGLPDGALGVAWPAMHQSLALPIGLAGVLTLVITLMSALSGFLSGGIVGRFGTGRVVLGSGLATGLALLLISQAQGFPWLLLAAVPLGFGAGAVDAGLNGFVAQHYRGRHMNWLHACWGIGATCGPLVVAYASGWRSGYLTLGAIQLTLGFVLLLALPLWGRVPLRSSAHAHEHPDRVPTRGAQTFAAWLSAAIFAVYVAAEGTFGLWAGSILVEGRGFRVREAGQAVMAFYGAIAVGRVLAGFASERVDNRWLVRGGVGLALLGAALFAFAPAFPVMVAGLLLSGLGFAPVYPGLMHEVPRRFSPDAVQTVIGRQVSAAYLGMAALPLLAGALAQTSLEAVARLLIAVVLILLVAIAWLDRLTPVRATRPVR